MFNVIFLASVYAHPFEYLIGNAIPSLVGLFIMKSRVHCISHLGWVMFRFFETHEVHSGLEFPISPFSVIPFGTGPKYHDYHHLKNQGNYGSFTSIWDTLFGTNQIYRELVSSKDKSE